MTIEVEAADDDPVALLNDQMSGGMKILLSFCDSDVETVVMAVVECRYVVHC